MQPIAHRECSSDILVLRRQNDIHNHEIAVLAWMEVALDLVNAADEAFDRVMGGEGFGEDGFWDLSRRHIGHCDAALKLYVSFHVKIYMAVWQLFIYA